MMLFEMADDIKLSLAEELEKAKEVLKDVDENIKRLTGRDPNEMRFLNQQRRTSLGGGGGGGGGNMEARGRERPLLFGGRRNEPGAIDGPPAKRRAIGGAFGRFAQRLDSRRSRGEDSADEDELPRKPTVQSSIVATPKEVKTRKDCLEEQKLDSRGLARNRRMFGLLLGTLQKFKDEETKKKDKEQKRIEIEQKLDAAAEKEREKLKQERQQLFLERRRRQADLRRLEHKIEVVKQQEDWEHHHRQLMQFAQTKAKPGIFWRPAKHNAATLQKLEESQKRLDEAMAIRRSEMEDELQAMNHNRISVEEPVEEPVDMEAEVDEEPALLAETAEAVEMALTNEPQVELPKEMEEEAMDEQKENVADMSNGQQQQQPYSQNAEQPTSQTEPADVEEASKESTAQNLPEVAKDDTCDGVEAAVVATEGGAESERIYDAEQNLTEKEFEPIYD